MAASVIRKYLMKKFMKPDASGIMTMPEKGKLDFSEHWLKERLFVNGIDHRTIQNEKQLENILYTLDKVEADKLKQKGDMLGLNDPKKNKFMKEGEVIEVDFGNWPEKKAGGGKAGLSYLLAEDTNERVPLFKGKIVKEIIKKVTKPKVKRKTEMEKALDMSRRELEYDNPASIYYDERRALQDKYPGITDDLLDMILADSNPQRKAEVLGTIDEALRMSEKGKGPKEIISIFQKTPRTKQAEGGLSGERMPYVFGGRTIGVLKNILSKMKQRHGIGRGEKTLKPDLVAKNLMSEEDKLKLLQLETNYANSILEHLKADRQLFKQLEVNKEMKDEGLDFLMKNFVETQAPHIKNYKSLADIDQAILELETLVKNKTLKEGRQLNADGGRIALGAGGGLPPVSFYFDMQGGAGKEQKNFLGVKGLTQKGYDYGGKLAADTTFPLFGGDLSIGGELGFGRNKSNVDYKGQPIDWLSNVGETKLGDDWNVGFKWRKKFAGGGMGRRAFLKILAALGVTGVAAKSGLAGLFKSGAKKKIAKDLTEVPIKRVDGMPSWFKPLVNKVIKEGRQAKVTEYDRLVTHTSKLPDSKTPISVNQDLNNGDVWVEIGKEKHGWADGKYGQPVKLEYKAEEILEPDISKSGKVKYEGGKSKEEFWVEEAEFTGGHPENVKFEESVFSKFGDHGSDFSEVEKFATGKTKKGARNVSESFDKMNEDIADRFSNIPRPDDYASGGIARMLGE